MLWNAKQMTAVKEFENQFDVDFIYYSDDFNECWKQNYELLRDSIEEKIRIAENNLR